MTYDEHKPKKIVFVTDAARDSQERKELDTAVSGLQSDGINAEIRSQVSESGDDFLFLTDDQHKFADMKTAGLNVIGFCKSGTEIPEFSGSLYVFADVADVNTDSYVKAYQRIKGFPWFILKTARCVVRETTVDDVDAFYKIYSDASMTEYMEGLFADPEDERKYTVDYISKVYGLMGFGVWTILNQATGEVMGRAGFSIRSGFDDIELGFLIAAPYQNKGYATEVCSAIMDFGKRELGFTRIQALVKEDNVKSVHVCEKLGFCTDEEVDIEENIYGDSYNGGAVSLSPVHYGSYRRMVCDMS